MSRRIKTIPSGTRFGHRKYEFTGETMRLFVPETPKRRITVHEIRALRDIPLHGVRKGDLGGWIENEGNLSHDDESWVGRGSFATTCVISFKAWKEARNLTKESAK